MTSTINLSTPVALLTVGQLLDIVNSEKKQEDANPERDKKSYVYGLRGIRDLFNVSHATAQRYKDTFLQPAVSQNGRKLLINAELAIELFNKKNGGTSK